MRRLSLGLLLALSACYSVPSYRYDPDTGTYRFEERALVSERFPLEEGGPPAVDAAESPLPEGAYRRLRQALAEELEGLQEPPDRECPPPLVRAGALAEHR